MKSIKTIKTKSPKETIERIEKLSKETGLRQETIITTAIIIGTMIMQNWLEEDK